MDKGKKGNMEKKRKDAMKTTAKKTKKKKMR